MNIAGQPAAKLVKGATRSWTMWFALALAAFGAIQLEMDHVEKLVSRETFGLFNIFVGVAVAVLRILTTMPLADRADE